jgi:hypothetical protein
MGFRNGKKTSTKNVERIGKHSELLAIDPDPLSYAKRRVQEFNEEFKSGKIKMSFEIDFEQKLPSSDDIASKSNLLNTGYFVLHKIYQDLKIADYFNVIQSDYKATFPCSDINRFLTFARILDPESKRGTFDKLDTYYEKPSFGYQNILRFMDILEENYDSYLEHLFINSENVVHRNTSVCYFDCTKEICA